MFCMIRGYKHEHLASVLLFVSEMGLWRGRPDLEQCLPGSRGSRQYWQIHGLSSTFKFFILKWITPGHSDRTQENVIFPSLSLLD